MLVQATLSSPSHIQSQRIQKIGSKRHRRSKASASCTSPWEPATPLLMLCGHPSVSLLFFRTPLRRLHLAVDLTTGTVLPQVVQKLPEDLAAPPAVLLHALLPEPGRYMHGTAALALWPADEHADWAGLVSHFSGCRGLRGSGACTHNYLSLLISRNFAPRCCNHTTRGVGGDQAKASGFCWLGPIDQVFADRTRNSRNNQDSPTQRAADQARLIRLLLIWTDLAALLLCVADQGLQSVD